MGLTAAPLEAPLLTGAELLAMGDVGPCELIDGRIVPMTPTGSEHAAIESNLVYELTRFVRERRLGWVLSGEVGIYTRRDPDRVRGADVALVSKALCPAAPPKGFLEVAPEMVGEVLSPGDRWQEVRQKVEEYFAAGVQQVWLVEPENRALLVCTSATDIDKYGETDTVTGAGILTGLVLPVASLFPD
ncbi:MAG: Uma2 family endonuclease [Deltaproteobacteria bacterium]|nr:Uma2 family endonuclease [Deltaproteobacteria bacterium]